MKKHFVVLSIILISVLVFGSIIAICLITGTGNNSNGHQTYEGTETSEVESEGEPPSLETLPFAETSVSEETLPSTDSSSSPESDDNLCVVDFRNDNGANINTVLVSKGDTIPKPSDPIQSNREFLGWYADDAGLTPFDFSAAVMNDTIIYAKWSDLPFGVIENIEFDLTTNTVLVKALANEVCSVLIRFIAEDDYFSPDYDHGQQYIEDLELRIEINPQANPVPEESAVYTYNIDISLPSYFVAEAIIVSNDSQPLSEAFVTIQHTSRFQRFASITVNDFQESDIVLKFTDEEDNNFGVLADDIKVMTAASVTEVPSEDDLATVYHITAPSQTISKGDKVYITGDGGEALLWVKDIQSSGDVLTITPVTITEENSYMLSNFYKFLKVDTSMQCGVVSDETASRQITPRSGIAAASAKASPSVSFPLLEPDYTFEGKHYSLSGEINGTVTFNLFMMYAPSLCGDQYFSMKITKDTDIYNNLTLAVKTEGNGIEKLKLSQNEENEILLGRAFLPLNVPGVSLFAELKLQLSYGATGSVTAENRIQKTTGFSYDSVNGFQFIDRQKVVAQILQCKGEAFIQAGLKFEIGFGFLVKAATAQIDAFAGVEVRGEAVGRHALTGSVAGEEDHLCDLCIDGGVYTVGEAGISFNVNFVFDIYQKDDPDATFSIGKSVSKSNKLFGFYASLISEGNFKKIGVGECPNRGTLVTIDIYPYLESCYLKYDAADSAPYHGAVVPNGEYNYPTELHIQNSDTGELIYKSYCPEYLKADYPDMSLVEISETYPTLAAIATPIKDAYDNTMYRISIPLPQGNYTASVLYANEKMMDAWVGPYDFVYSEPYEGCYEDYGDISFSVLPDNEDDVSPPNGNDFKIYPEDRATTTRTYEITFISALWDDLRDAIPCANEEVKIGVGYISEAWSYDEKSQKNTTVWWRAINRILIRTDQNGTMHITVSIMDIPGKASVKAFYSHHLNHYVSGHKKDHYLAIFSDCDEWNFKTRRFSDIICDC